jgi:hypothetical protein
MLTKPARPVLLPPPITQSGRQAVTGQAPGPAQTNEERILEHVANIDRIVSTWWAIFKLAAFVGLILWAVTIAALFMSAK